MGIFRKWPQGEFEFELLEHVEYLVLEKVFLKYSYSGLVVCLFSLLNVLLRFLLIWFRWILVAHPQVSIPGGFDKRWK